MNLMVSARQVAARLKREQRRLVLAESCTAGLISATLARVPGISEWLCGSAVTYRDWVKEHWLGIPASEIDMYTAVSEPVARSMALGVLRRTQDAELSLSITGHLGPKAPADLDGVVFVALAERWERDTKVLHVFEHKLKQASRYQRQQEAVDVALHDFLKLFK